MYSRLKDVFKNRWTFLIYVWSTASIYLYLHHVSTPPVTVNEGVYTTEIPMSSKPVIHYDVLLSSYMRSGSTLTGMILGWRDDAFYLFEPLRKFSGWTYWHGNDTVCRSDRLACSLSDGSMIMAKKILSEFYDCKFLDFERMGFDTRFTVENGGPSWGEVRTCIKRKGNPKLCLHRYVPRKCKNATHRVSKVLRLTTDLLSDLLFERKNLKVIHLFRDPRAIINSRNQTWWYFDPTPRKLVENAKSLCSKMLYDLREGKALRKLYPDRFKIIYYEDLNENPFTKVKILFKYLGMDLNENKYPKIRQLPVFSNSDNRTSREKNTAFWWRHSLNWDIVQKMEQVCSGVYKELGYKSMSNEEDFRNLSISSLDIPKEYLLI